MTVSRLLIPAPIAALAVLLLATSTTARAQKDTDCAGLKLAEASGIPEGSSHVYRFQGTCDITERSNGRTYLVAQQWTRAEAMWQAATGEFHESVTTEGKYPGTIEMWLKCGRDPVIESGSCIQVKFQNPTGWPGFDGAWKQHRPVTRGKTTLAEATAIAKRGPLAAEPSGGAPSKEGAVAGKAITSPSGIVALEAETLLPSAQATHGKVGVQRMTDFGNVWGGNEQLFWEVGQPGAQLRVEPKVPRAGRYEVFVAFTKAPDFGLLEASFDGGSAITINGYGKDVTRDRALLGMFDLTAGPHQLLLAISGRDRLSTGFRVGIDRIELKPVP